jgi:hypothetical protein
LIGVSTSTLMRLYFDRQIQANAGQIPARPET